MRGQVRMCLRDSRLTGSVEVSLLATTLHERKQVLQVGHTHQGAGRREGRLFQADGDHRRMQKLGEIPCS